MPALDVVPDALVSAAAAVRCFALAVAPVSVRTDGLGGALQEFADGWAYALRVLTTDADTTAHARREAAQRYADLESLLVPRALQ